MMDLGSLFAKGAGAGTMRQRKIVEQRIGRSILKLPKLEDLHDLSSFLLPPSRHTDTDPRSWIWFWWLAAGRLN